MLELRLRVLMLPGAAAAICAVIDDYRVVLGFHQSRAWRTTTFTERRRRYLAFIRARVTLFLCLRPLAPCNE